MFFLFRPIANLYDTNLNIRIIILYQLFDIKKNKIIATTLILQKFSYVNVCIVQVKYVSSYKEHKYVILNSIQTNDITDFREKYLCQCTDVCSVQAHKTLLSVLIIVRHLHRLAEILTRLLK